MLKLNLNNIFPVLIGMSLVDFFWTMFSGSTNTALSFCILIFLISIGVLWRSFHPTGMSSEDEGAEICRRLFVGIIGGIVFNWFGFFGGMFALLLYLTGQVVGSLDARTEIRKRLLLPSVEHLEAFIVRLEAQRRSKVSDK